MSGPTIGALFAGYGGLDLAVRDVFPTARLAWVSEFDAAPSRILAQRFPDAPNHGDVTAINWHAVEPVDIITGGSPCQDLSHAGKRAGMKAGTRSGLWASMCDAVDIIRPRLVIWENVRGALSAPATAGDVESCGFCMADTGEPPLRALGRVLGDLAELGYDAAWTGLRAADVGAPHGRWRVFVLAWPADAESDSGWLGDGDDGAATHAADRVRLGDDTPAGVTPLLRTPTARLAVNGGSQHPDKRKAGGHGPTLADEVEHLLPTPAVNDMGASYDVEGWDAWTARMKAAHGNGNGHGASLHIEALRMLPTPTTQPTTGNGHARSLGGETRDLLPTPRATDGTKGGPNQRGSSGDLMLPSAVALLPTPRASDGPDATSHGRSWSATDHNLHTVARRDEFGQYTRAIARWEAIIGRPAPAPTEPTGRGGAHRLSPRFVEWMMGLPDGWVTDTDTSRNEQLKALGNGVVPQQAAAAIRHLLGVRANALAVAA